MNLTALLGLAERAHADAQKVRDAVVQLDFKAIRGSRTQSEVAHLAGVSQVIISRFERNTIKGLSTPTLLRVLRAYLVEEPCLV